MTFPKRNIAERAERPASKPGGARVLVLGSWFLVGG